MEKLLSIRKGPSASGIHGDAKLLTLVELWEADHRHGKGLESIVGDFDLVGQAVLPSAVFFFFCSAGQIPSASSSFTSLSPFDSICVL